VLSVITSVVVSEVVLLLVACAASVVTFRWWRGRWWMGAAAGVLGIGVVAWLDFLVTWFAPRLLLPFVAVVLAAAVVALVVRRAWRWWRVVLLPSLLIAGVTAAYLGMFGFWGLPADPFAWAAIRFSSTNHVLPIDNQLPWLFQQTLESGRGTHGFDADWNGSDRPPLLSGIIGIIQPLTDLVGIRSSASAFGASLVGQLLWVPAVFVIARAIGVGRRGAVFAVLAAASLGTTLLNSVYTWPKMTSAAFVLIALALLVDARRSRAAFGPRLVGAAIGIVLGVLAHGAAAFAIPLLVLVGLAALRGRTRTRVLAAGGVGLGAMLLIYAPWFAYQKFADPPGDRLLKWHLAGVIPVDGRSFPQAFIDSYSTLSPAHWISGRLDNLFTVLSSQMFAGMPWTANAVTTRRSVEFFYTSAALGLWSLCIIGVTIALVVRRILRRIDAFDRTTTRLLIGSAISIALWCLVMFIPGATFVHQGSQVWIFVLVVAPALWLWRRARGVAWTVLIVQALVTAAEYLPDPSPAGRPSVSGLVLLVCGTALCVVTVISPTADRLMRLDRVSR
jgi:hypothetical protein